MIDVKPETYKCDAYATSGHKWLLGPKGTGFLCVDKRSIKKITPRFIGAYSDDGFTRQKKTNTFNDVPFCQYVDTYRYSGTAFKPRAQHFEYGTHSSQIINGLFKAIQIYKEIGAEQIQQKI